MQLGGTGASWERAAGMAWVMLQCVQAHVDFPFYIVVLAGAFPCTYTPPLAMDALRSHYVRDVGHRMQPFC